MTDDEQVIYTMALLNRARRDSAFAAELVDELIETRCTPEQIQRWQAAKRVKQQ